MEAGIAIIEPNAVHAEALAALVEHAARRRVHRCASLDEGLAAIEEGRAAFAIVGPALSQNETTRARIKSGAAFPMLLLCEGGAGEQGVAEQRVQRLECPFHASELLAHIERLAGRARDRARERIVSIGRWRFDPLRRHLTPPKTEGSGSSSFVRLTEQEAKMLLYLHGKADRSAERAELLREVWGYHPGADTDTLETHIYRLRRKIAAVAGTQGLILRVNGAYRLAPH